LKLNVMNPLLLAILAAALIWSAAAGVYVVILRKRLMARFERGFLYSLLVAMVGGALMSSSIVGIWGYQSAKLLLEEEVVEELADIGLIVETELTNELENVSRQLKGFGTSLLPLVDGKGAAVELTDRLQMALSVNERFLELHLFDGDGRIIASSSRIENAEPISKQAIGANLDGKPFVSDAEKSKAFDREVLFISQPLRTQPDRCAARSVRDTTCRSSRGPGRHHQVHVSGYAVMIDGDGQIVAHHDRSRLEEDASSYPAVQLARQTGKVDRLSRKNNRGQDKLFVYRPIDNPGARQTRLGAADGDRRRGVDRAGEQAARRVCRRRRVVAPPQHRHRAPGVHVGAPPPTGPR
jgi:hypothetical protein